MLIKIRICFENVPEIIITVTGSKVISPHTESVSNIPKQESHSAAETYSFTEAARILGVGRNKLTQWLVDEHYLYRIYISGKSHLLVNGDKPNKGMFVETVYGNGKFFCPIVRVTSSGLEKIRYLLSNLGNEL